MKYIIRIKFTKAFIFYLYELLPRNYLDNSLKVRYFKLGRKLSFGAGNGLWTGIFH